MALSGSYNFSLNGNELIKDACIEANIIEPTETVNSDMNAHARRTLNRMMKALQADGLQLWLKRDATMFLESDKTTYTLNNTGDHVTEDTVAETAIKVAASVSDTSIDVDSTTGMAASDYIGIECDDGTMHWTTISSVTDSDTVVITDAIDDEAAVDNVVYHYTNKIQQPLRLYEAYYSQWGSSTQRNDRPLNIYAQEEYFSLSDKTVEGEVNSIMFMPQRTLAEVRVWPEPNDVKDYLKLVLLFPMADIDSATDDFEFPNYWYEAVLYGLAYRLAMAYKNKDRIPYLRAMAMETHRHAMDFDVENTSVFLQPNARMSYGR